MKHPPRVLRLLTGKDVKVVKAHYPMGRNIWREEYEGHKGCLAELFDHHFEEVVPKSYKETSDVD